MRNFLGRQRAIRTRDKKANEQAVLSFDNQGCKVADPSSYRVPADLHVAAYPTWHYPTSNGTQVHRVQIATDIFVVHTATTGLCERCGGGVRVLSMG